MTTSGQIELVAPPPLHFEVFTTHSDATKAVLRVRGDLDVDNAQLLAAVIDSHVRVGRRFLRLNVSAVTSLDTGGIVVLERAHGKLLSVRGTMILTGVQGPVADALVIAGLDRLLFALPPTAADSIE